MEGKNEGGLFLLQRSLVEKYGDRLDLPLVVDPVIESLHAKGDNFKRRKHKAIDSLT